MKLIKRIRRLFCKHPIDHLVITEYAKHKWVNLRGNNRTHKLRYDIYRKDVCGYCGKELGRGKIKSNLTECQVEKMFNSK